METPEFLKREPSNNIRVAKRITGKRPVSQLSVSSVARDEPASSSSVRPVAFERHGVGWQEWSVGAALLLLQAPTYGTPLVS